MIQRFRTIYRWLGPAWLTQLGDGELNLHSIGVMCDAFAERCRLSLLAKFPSYAESDTLDLIGRDRGITRGIDEPKESYAPRLIRWWEDLRKAGTAWTLLDQLRAYVQHDCKLETVDNSGNRYTLNEDGTKTFTKGTWNWDGSTSLWARFWVIIDQSGSVTRWAPKGTVGSTGGKVGSRNLGVGGTMTTSQATAIKQLIQGWKPAGTMSWACIVVHDSLYYPDDVAYPGNPMPDGNWGKYYKLDGTDSEPSIEGPLQIFHVSARSS
jgi:hypothetical protein